MKLKLVQLVQAEKALAYLGEQKLSPALALKLNRAMRVIRPELEEYNKVRVEIFSHHGIQVGDQIQVAPENIPALNAELLTIDTSEELTLEINPIPYSLVTCNLSSDDLTTLEWLFDFEYRN